MTMSEFNKKGFDLNARAYKVVCVDNYNREGEPEVVVPMETLRYEDAYAVAKVLNSVSDPDGYRFYRVEHESYVVRTGP